MKNYFSLKVNKLLMLVIFCFLASCSKEFTQLSPDVPSDIKVKNGRLAFKDTKTLQAVLDQLKTLSINEEAEKWENQYNYTSLRKYNWEHRTETRLESMHLPLSLRAILNENGEYEVGNVIAWFNEGQVHFIDNLDEEQLKKIKQNISLSKNKHSVESKIVSVQSDVSTMGNINGQTNDQRDARYQHEWLMNNTSSDRRKTIYEIYAITTPVGPTPDNLRYEAHWDFYLEAKFEWYYRGWQPNANEWHVVQLHFNGSAQPNCNVYLSGGPKSFNYQENRYTNGNVQLTLASGSFFTDAICTAGSLDYSINGYISSDVYDANNHSIHQTASGYYTGTGNLW